jgi:hypothetical protein
MSISADVPSLLRGTSPVTSPGRDGYARFPALMAAGGGGAKNLGNNLMHAVEYAPAICADVVLRRERGL